MGSSASTSGSSTTGTSSGEDVIIYTTEGEKQGRTLDVKPDWNNTSILPPFNSPSGVDYHS